MLSQEEFERFDKLFEEELKPFFNENEQEIENIINSNPQMKKEIEEELQNMGEAKAIPYVINLITGVKKDLEYDDSNPKNWVYTHIAKRENKK